MPLNDTARRALQLMQSWNESIGFSEADGGNGGGGGDEHLPVIGILTEDGLDLISTEDGFVIRTEDQDQRTGPLN